MGASSAVTEATNLKGSYWVGEVLPLRGELCPDCLCQGLVWVPFYTKLQGDIHGITCYKRVACRDCGYGYVTRM